MKLYWDKRQMKWVDRPTQTGPRVYLQSDYEATESPITGEVIHGRKAYHDHLSDFGYHVKEPGDVASKPLPDRQGIRSAIKESLRELKVH